ncbi:hypothetical protein [Ruminococcus flavefaciens]|uniref:hypothetical protein n=1 Tax=Ruminococcus flavefaciens TaxID=1265 RepID=UPI00159D0166|nr:hypothetical protein [Ruminococcus flavefaciens]
MTIRKALTDSAVTVWYYYTDADGILGTWVNGGWVMYEPGINGYWDESSHWHWNGQ